MDGIGLKAATAVWLLLFLISCAFLPNASRAQGVNGSIVGTIRDAQGAVVPNAKVSAKNTATGLERDATTDNAGGYTIVSVPAGPYQVTAAVPGFQTEVRSGVTMTVGAAVRVDFTLKVGAVEQQVTVTGEAPQVDTTTSTLSGLVSENQVRDLPLNGRDWLQLGALQAGVLTLGTTGTGSVTLGMGLTMSIAGGRPSDNAYHVDGLVINDQTNSSPGNAMGANLGVDSIREFSILTNTYGAQYGRSAGGVINAITNSGTNNIHGTAFEFLRNSALDARNFFDVANAPLPSPVPTFRRNQFGGSIGGPIKKDKLFFFANYEGLRQYLAETPSTTFTLSADARNGLLCSNPPACTSFSQVTVDPKVVPYLALFPLPTQPTDNITGQFLTPTAQNGAEDFTVGRIDYDLDSNDTISGTYTFDNTNLTVPDALDEKLEATRSRNQRVALSYIHIFSGAVLNTAHAGFSRTAAASGLDTSPMTSLLTDPSLGFTPGENVGTINVPGLTSFGGIGSSGADIFWYTAPQFADDLSWVKGKNTITMGFSVEDVRDNVEGLNNPAGVWQFGSIQNFLTDTSPLTFNSDFPGTPTLRGQRTKLFGMYIQDDVRLRPNFTLNVGVRYEPATAITEVNGLTADLTPHLTDPTMTIGNPEFGNPSLKTVMPRLGFAWDPTGSGKTAIRAGVGMFDPPTVPGITSNRIIRAAPFFESGTLISPSPSLFPNGAFAQESLSTLTTVFMQPNPPMPYTFHWDFDIERQLTQNMSLTVGYVGSRGVHLPLQQNDTDQVPGELVTTAPNGDLKFPCTENAAGACTGPPPGGIPRINPNFGKIQTEEWYGWSKFNELEVSLTKRFSHGFTFQGAYTWSKSMDIGAMEYSSSQLPNSMDVPYAFDPELNSGVSDYDIPQKLTANFVYDTPAPRANLNVVPRFLLSGWEVGGIYTIESGTPFSIKLANDQALTGNSEAGNRSAGQRPDYVGGPGCSPDAVNVGTSNPYDYINEQCFALPALGTLGNMGRNVLRGPGLQNFDFSLFKNHNVGERLKIQFRAEFFNLFNEPDFQFGTTTGFTSSGQLVPSNFAPKSPTVESSREIQFALKFIF